VNLDTGYATPVSMVQSLSGTDWYMESFGLTVSFSLYGDLLGTSSWARREQAKCIKSGICKTTEEPEAEPVVVEKKVEEPKPAPEEIMNNEAAAPSSEELNFEKEEEDEVDPDDEFHETADAEF